MLVKQRDAMILCRANVEVTGATRLYRAASVWTAGFGLPMQNHSPCRQRRLFLIALFINSVVYFGMKSLPSFIFGSKGSARLIFP